MKLINLYDGIVLSKNDGIASGDLLVITAKIEAPINCTILVNEKTAAYCDGYYFCDISLDGYRNTVEVICNETDEKVRIAVYYPKNAFMKYRFSLDDNIWFLRNIYEKNYDSLFEDPYLGFMKSLNDEFGTKIHINIYYECENFNLSMFPDKYKNEWQANSDWIHLGFHAKANDPDMPYKQVSYDQMKREFLQVQNEICRFAGAELTGTVIDIHWGECTVQGVRALRAQGVRALSGYFIFDQNDDPYISYHMSHEQVANYGGRPFMRDEAEDMMFIRTAIILNDYTPESAVMFLDKLKSDQKRNPFLEIMIHEQYFYPTYINYKPQFCEIVRTAIRWARDNGYEPAFIRDSVLEW